MNSEANEVTLPEESRFSPYDQLSKLVDDVEYQAKAAGSRGVAVEVFQAGHALELVFAKVGRLVDRKSDLKRKIPPPPDLLRHQPDLIETHGAER